MLNLSRRQGNVIIGFAFLELYDVGIHLYHTYRSIVFTNIKLVKSKIEFKIVKSN